MCLVLLVLNYFPFLSQLDGAATILFDNIVHTKILYFRDLCNKPSFFLKKQLLRPHHKCLCIINTNKFSFRETFFQQFCLYDVDNNVPMLLCNSSCLGVLQMMHPHSIPIFLNHLFQVLIACG